MSDRHLLGIDEARRALAAGRAAVLPNPSPLAYFVVATAPHVVNAAKGRPPQQEVAVSVHDEREWQALVPSLDLEPAAVAKAHAQLREEGVTILAPLKQATVPPPWVHPAVRDGHILIGSPNLSMFGREWEPLASLWAEFPRLYGSSANHTGQPAATTAAEARAMFDHTVPVVHGDALRDLDLPHAATTILRISTDATLTLVRHGAQDTTYRDGPEAYLRRLNAPERH